MKNSIRVGGTLALLCCAGNIVNAEQKTPAPTSAPVPVAAHDHLRHGAAVGLAELELGED